MNREQFLNECKKLNIDLQPEQMEKFQLYYNLLIDWNAKINLTAITEKEEVFLKHFYDSLTIVQAYSFSEEKSLSICDVGSGAGFPSIPLKIVYPHIQVSIVDSLKKRISFLEDLVEKLQLEFIDLFHDRAENFGQNKNYREKYDVVTARAVARLSVLSEFCLPLTKVGGHFIAMKGASGQEEIIESKNAIKLLGGKVHRTHAFTLPIENSERTIFDIKKIKNTPKKYPRKPGTPIKMPL